MDWRRPEQSGSKRVLHSHTEQAPPPPVPALGGSSSERSKSSRGSRTDELRDEAERLVVPTSAGLAHKHAQPLRSSPKELGVGGAFAAFGDGQGSTEVLVVMDGLLARRAKLVEQAWLAVCREAQWLSHTSAPGVPTSDRRRLDLVVHGASPLGLSRKRATYPELQRGGGHRLFVLGSGLSVRHLPASTAWARRWWGMLSTAVQHAVGGTALGALALAERAGPSRLPLR
ncbi:unnamed protein product [Symbiodinium sp. KB8]|nr:unnamed protein product [Symbiodinium sp. KB8]